MESKSKKQVTINFKGKDADILDELQKEKGVNLGYLFRKLWQENKKKIILQYE